LPAGVEHKFGSVISGGGAQAWSTRGAFDRGGIVVVMFWGWRKRPHLEVVISKTIEY
jgi:hypothetical protein